LIHSVSYGGSFYTQIQVIMGGLPPYPDVRGSSRTCDQAYSGSNPVGLHFSFLLIVAVDLAERGLYPIGIHLLLQLFI